MASKNETDRKSAILPMSIPEKFSKTVVPNSSERESKVVCVPKVLFENRIEETLNVKEAAAFLKVSTKTVYAQASDGVLPCQRIGNRYIFLRSELVRFLKGE